MNRRDFLQSLLLIPLGLGSLTNCTCSEVQPKEPIWNSEVCAHCRMTLVDKNFGAQIVGPGYSWQFFDDLGCALAHLGGQSSVPSSRLYIRIHGKGGWELAEKARFADGFKTPMNYGIGAVMNGPYSFDQVKNLLSTHGHGGHHQ